MENRGLPTGLRFSRPTHGALAAVLVSVMGLPGAVGCGGGAPLLHPAHVLRPGFVSMGAGLSGQLALRQVSEATAEPDATGGGKVAARTTTLQDLAVSPKMAPWVSGRAGLRGENEAGLTYTGRSVRLDGRHAFALGSAALSVGVGGSVLLPERPGSDAETRSVYGGGFDVPVLLGVSSTSDLYALWVGPRMSFEVLGGHLDPVAGGEPTPGPRPSTEVDARHFFAGGVAGIRAGFRHLHAAFELDAGYHHAGGTLAGRKLTLRQVTLTPGGALILSF